MAEQFYTILTAVGKAKIANAAALGKKVELTELALGDGGGSYYSPTEDQTALKNEVWRGAIGTVDVDGENPNWIIIQTVVPSQHGGFMIREAGVFDNEGDLIAVGKYPETYKPVAADGSIKDLVIRMILEVSNTASVVLKVDPTVILATQQQVNEAEARAKAYTDQEVTEVSQELDSHLAENVHKQRSATVIVATYNSKQSSKDGADYVCLQTNAQELINQAIQDIADTGGKIILMEGIYNISSPININVSNVTLEGMGQSTVIDANETPTNCIICENVENVTIKSITAKNTSLKYNCMFFRNITNCVVADCKLVNNDGNGINMDQAIDSIVRNCISDSNGLNGIRLEKGINCKIANNICRKNFICGILINSSSYCCIADNILIDNTHQNSDPDNYYGHIGMFVGAGQSNDNNYIVGNICRGQAYRGIAVRGSNNIVIHNDLRGSGTIELQDGGTNTMTELAGNAISS